MKKRGTLSRVFFWGIVLVLIGSLLVAVFSNNIEGVIQGNSPSASTFQSELSTISENAQLLEIALVDPETTIDSDSEFEILITNTSDRAVGIKSIGALMPLSGNSSRFIVNTAGTQTERYLKLEPNETISVPAKFDFGLRAPNMFSISVYGYFIVDGILLESESPVDFENRVGGTLEIFLSP